MKASTAIAKILKAEGVEYVFCFPTSPLLEGAAEEGIRIVTCRTERHVVNMADGYARVTNGKRVGVCMVQEGAGIENAFVGVAQAYADSTPLLILPSATERERMGLPAEFDAIGNYKGVTKWADTINSAARVPEMLARAFTALRMGRPRPVLLETPEDVASEDLSDGPFSYQPVEAFKSAGNPRDISEALTLLLAARRPVLHIGQGMLYAEACEELRAFAELLQVPVMTTLLGKSAFPENHPLALGAGGSTVTALVDRFLTDADLIFSIGSSLSRTLASCAIPPGKTFIQCTIDERDINAEYRVTRAIIGDAKLVLQQLIDEAKQRLGAAGRKPDESLIQEIRTTKEEWLRRWMPKLTSDEVPINPYRVIWDMMHTVDPTRTIVTHDSGSPRNQIAPFYEAVTPRGFIGWGNSHQLGASLGLIMGAKLGAPDKLAINVLGDAGVGMCGMDFETAVRERIPILTIILNNSTMAGYGRRIPRAIERYNVTQVTGDYLGLAKSLGCYGERVEQPDGVVAALKRAIGVVESGQPAVLEVITKPEEAASRLRRPMPD